MNREKQERQAHEASVHREGRKKACHLSGTSDVLLWGLPILRTTLCISPVVLATMREIQNVVCLNAFPLVPPKPHSRQPSLRDAILGVANREVSQAEESARRLSGRYSLDFLLANPLPCHSLRLISEYEMAEKGSTNDKAVSHEVTGGTWNKKIEGTNVRGGTILLQKWIGEEKQ